MSKIRFVVKKVNGAWAVFDTLQFRNVTVRTNDQAAIREAQKRNENG